MSELLISRAAASDQPQLHQLWQDVFGDSDELILAFFDCFPPEAAAWIVRQGETILSAAYLIPGNLYMNDPEIRPAGYVYAVATALKHRGKGYAGMLMRALASEAKDREILLYTRPAEPSLFPWYEKTMSASHTAHMMEMEVPQNISTQFLPCNRLTPEAYGAQRELLLQHTPHIVLSDRFLKLQEFYSSGFYAVGSSLCCCSTQEQSLVIPEYIGPSENCDAAAQALMNHFGKQSAVIRLEQPDGALRSIAYCGEKMHPNTHWGLFLE